MGERREDARRLQAPDQQIVERRWPPPSGLPRPAGLSHQESESLKLNLPSLLSTRTMLPSFIFSISASQSGIATLRQSPSMTEIPLADSFSAAPRSEER